MHITCISCVWRVYDAYTCSHYTQLQSRISEWFLPVCHTLHNMICIYSDTLYKMKCVWFVHVLTLYEWFAIMCIYSDTLHTCGAGSRHNSCLCLIPYTTWSVYPFTFWYPTQNDMSSTFGQWHVVYIWTMTFFVMSTFGHPTHVRSRISAWFLPASRAFWRILLSWVW